MSLLWWLYNFPRSSINMVNILTDFQMLNQSSWHNSPSVSNIFYMLWNSLQFCLGSFFCIHEWHYFTVFISCHVFCSRAVVQSLSAVQLFVTPWTAAHQASLSITNSWSLLKLMSINRVSDAIQPSHPLSSPSPPAFILVPAFSLVQHQGLFWWVSSSHQVVKVLKL